MKKDYPVNEKEWLKYLTIDNYYTFFEIERRKKLFQKQNVILTQQLNQLINIDKKISY